MGYQTGSPIYGNWTHLFLPCHTSSLLMCLNWVMEKSAAREACLPSCKEEITWEYFKPNLFVA